MLLLPVQVVHLLLLLLPLLVILLINSVGGCGGENLVILMLFVLLVVVLLVVVLLLAISISQDIAVGNLYFISGDRSLWDYANSFVPCPSSFSSSVCVGFSSSQTRPGYGSSSGERTFEQRFDRLAVLVGVNLALVDRWLT